MTRKLSPLEIKLLVTIKKYKSIEELRNKDLPKFLLARSKNLLKLAFDIKAVESEEDLKTYAARIMAEKFAKNQRQAATKKAVDEYFKQQEY